MLKNNLGYPRVGPQRQLKRACEQFWNGKISQHELMTIAHSVEEDVWKVQLNANIDLIPINDFSLYDQVLDMALLLGVIPDRFTPLMEKKDEIDLYFAMARGHQKNGFDITPMEMTKWFDTNYHYIVPEFKAGQEFKVFSQSLFERFGRAKHVLGHRCPKPVLIGPLSFLLLGKEKEENFTRLDLLEKVLPIYIEILSKLKELGAEWVQMDEPCLVLDISDRARKLLKHAYEEIQQRCGLKILIATYFDGIMDKNLPVALSLPVSALHLDLVRDPEQLDRVLNMVKTDSATFANPKLALSLGVIDGRNVWKNDFNNSLEFIKKAIDVVGKDRILISPSCSLLHVPFDLDCETQIDPDMKNWMAFAKQKLHEISDLFDICNNLDERTAILLANNLSAATSRKQSTIVHNPQVKQRILSITPTHCRRNSPFNVRQKLQRQRFKLPRFATTTIGSFPQTAEIRQLRAKLKSGELDQQQYEQAIEKATVEVLRWQEEVGLDVLVHGEFERNDMVEYFGELLSGFVFTQNGWVTSYGSRCVKPPIIFGDVMRPSDMTVRWSAFAQSQTEKLLKGMLTGPVTILQWSFVRDDQPRSATALQLAFAIRDEAAALESAGLKVIQIDEPAIREGLPLQRKKWEAYLEWAVNAFRLASSGVKDETQIHTHMCYSEFNDIIEHIAMMDADVISIENSRSQKELLRAFGNFKYPNEIGPGVYDIHSPRVPSAEEMFDLLKHASALLPPDNIWVNPDCGLKTRAWSEAKTAIANMVEAARRARKEIGAN